MRLWGTLCVALLIGLLLWAGSSGKLRAVFAGNGDSAPAPGAAQRPPAETIDSLLAKSARLPGMREAIEQARPYAMNVCGLDNPIIIDPQAQQPNEEEKALLDKSDRVLQSLGKTLAQASDDATKALGLQIFGLTEAERAAADAQLFALAAKTKSAYAYRIALTRCRLSTKPQDCRDLGAKRLTELEPDNADNWLSLAHEELAAKRPEAAAAAFARAAQAKRYDSHYAEPFKLAQIAVANLQTPLEQTLAPLALFGVSAAAPWPQLQQASKHCEEKLVDRDPKRRSDCRQLGDLMAGSDTAISAKIGLALKERVADSAAELEAIKIKRDALRYAQDQVGNLTGDLPRGDELYSCEAARRFKDFIAELIKSGEMGLVRQELQRQNLSEEQAAALYRARQTQ